MTLGSNLKPWVLPNTTTARMWPGQDSDGSCPGHLGQLDSTGSGGGLLLWRFHNPRKSYFWPSPVTESKLVLLATWQANKSRDQVLGQGIGT